MSSLEAEEQGKYETMDNEGAPMLSNDNYQQWKEKMKYNLMNHVVLYWVCNGFTKIPPSNEEVKNNNKALIDIINIIHYSTLNGVMHYATAKELWDKIKEIHEGITKEYCSSKEPISNVISKENNDASKDEYVTNS